MYVDPSFSQDLKEGVKKILFFFLYLLRNIGFWNTLQIFFVDYFHGLLLLLLLLIYVYIIYINVDDCD